MRALWFLLLILGCGEPIQPAAPRKTLPFAPRPGTAEVGEATVMHFEAKAGELEVKHQYTDVILEVAGGRAARVKRGEATLRWEDGRFVDEQGKPRVSFELFEQLLPPREGDDVPTTWTRSGVLGSLHKVLPDHWDEQGGTAECEFEEILVQKGRSEAWVAVRYKDRSNELTGRLTFDLNERLLTRVELRGEGLILTASRRITTVK